MLNTPYIKTVSLTTTPAKIEASGKGVAYVKMVGSATWVMRRVGETGATAIPAGFHAELDHVDLSDIEVAAASGTASLQIVGWE